MIALLAELVQENLWYGVLKCLFYNVGNYVFNAYTVLKAFSKFNNISSNNKAIKSKINAFSFFYIKTSKNS